MADRPFQRRTSPEMRAEILAGHVPAGRWRVGTACPQQLHIDHPDGDGATLDVGRLDNPALAAYVVDAVNAGAASLRIDGYSVSLYRDPNSGDMRVEVRTPDGVSTEGLAVDVNDERVWDDLS